MVIYLIQDTCQRVMNSANNLYDKLPNPVKVVAETAASALKETIKNLCKNPKDLGYVLVIGATIPSTFKLAISSFLIYKITNIAYQGIKFKIFKKEESFEISKDDLFSVLVENTFNYLKQVQNKYKEENLWTPHIYVNELKKIGLNIDSINMIIAKLNTLKDLNLSTPKDLNKFEELKTTIQVQLSSIKDAIYYNSFLKNYDIKSWKIKKGYLEKLPCLLQKVTNTFYSIIRNLINHLISNPQEIGFIILISTFAPANLGFSLTLVYFITNYFLGKIATISYQYSKLTKTKWPEITEDNLIKISIEKAKNLVTKIYQKNQSFQNTQLQVVFRKILKTIGISENDCDNIITKFNDIPINNNSKNLVIFNKMLNDFIISLEKGLQNAKNNNKLSLNQFLTIIQ